MMRVLGLGFGLLLVAAAMCAPATLPSLAICVAIKDQAADVREWIIYHHALGGWQAPLSSWCPGNTPADCGPAGVQKFYIWDTGSVPPLLVRAALGWLLSQLLRTTPLPQAAAQMPPNVAWRHIQLSCRMQSKTL